MKKVALALAALSTGLMLNACGTNNLNHSDVKTLSRPFKKDGKTTNQSILFTMSGNDLELHKCLDVSKPENLDNCTLFVGEFDEGDITGYRNRTLGAYELLQLTNDRDGFAKQIADTVELMKDSPNNPGLEKQKEGLEAKLQPIAARIDTINANIAALDRTLAKIKSDKLWATTTENDLLGSDSDVGLAFLRYVYITVK